MGKSILIVEDDYDVRTAIRDALELEGYAVLSAANGRDGIDILKRTKPSLVLLDLMMPVMDGYEFLQRFRTEQGYTDIPVVVLSASQVSKAPEGAVALYPKPLGLQSLLEVAQQYC